MGRRAPPPAVLPVYTRIYTCMRSLGGGTNLPEPRAKHRDGPGDVQPARRELVDQLLLLHLGKRREFDHVHGVVDELIREIRLLARRFLLLLPRCRLLRHRRLLLLVDRLVELLREPLGTSLRLLSD